MLVAHRATRTAAPSALGAFSADGTFARATLYFGTICGTGTGRHAVQAVSFAVCRCGEILTTRHARPHFEVLTSIAQNVVRANVTRDRLSYCRRAGNLLVIRDRQTDDVRAALVLALANERDRSGSQAQVLRTRLGCSHSPCETSTHSPARRVALRLIRPTSPLKLPVSRTQTAEARRAGEPIRLGRRGADSATAACAPARPAAASARTIRTRVRSEVGDRSRSTLSVVLFYKQTTSRGYETGTSA